MSHTKAATDLRQALANAGPYPLAAYNFLQEGLRVTVERIHEQQERQASLGHASLGSSTLGHAALSGTGPEGHSLSEIGAPSRHISGQQLCMGLRDYAIEQYGLLACSVLAHWHIHRTDDFGRMVFALVDAGLMSKTAQDTAEDFRGVYDFAEAFHPEHLAGAMRTAAR